jgi:hypothetical protein
MRYRRYRTGVGGALAGSTRGSAWSEAKISGRLQLRKGTAAHPRCVGRYRLVGISLGRYGRSGHLCAALAYSASPSHVRTDRRNRRTHHPRSSCGCSHGDIVAGTRVADRFHRPLHRHQLEHGAAERLEARIRLTGKRIHLTHVEQHPYAIWHALCAQPRELESHHCTRWFSHRRPSRRTDRFLCATVELSAQ